MVRVSAHAGFAQAPRHADTRGELTRRAELALRAGGQEGAGRPSSPSSLRSTRSRPIRNSSSANCRARSAPTSWNCITSRSSRRKAARSSASRRCCAGRTPRAARSPPATFIPVAEQMGLMDTLGAFVLRRALQEAKRWPELYIAVNLSPLAGARPGHRRTGALGAGRERRSAVAADARNHRRRADRQSGRDGQAHRGPACARRAHRARRFRLRLFEPRLSAAFPARQAQDRQQLRHRARHARPMAA